MPPIRPDTTKTKNKNKTRENWGHFQKQLGHVQSLGFLWTRRSLRLGRYTPLAPGRDLRVVTRPGRRREWLPTPVSLPGESHGQRSLMWLRSIKLERVGYDWSNLACMHEAGTTFAFFQASSAWSAAFEVRLGPIQWGWSSCFPWGVAEKDLW